MSNVLIFSDIHIASHKNSLQRLEDCLKTLRWVCSTAIENKIEKVIFAGDLFQERQKIQTLAYQKTFEIFQEYCSRLSFDLILGNHDMWFANDWSISSIIPFQTIPNMNIFNQPSTVKIYNRWFDYLPYTHHPTEHLKSLEQDASEKILVSHLAVEGAILNFTYGTISGDTALENENEMTKVTPNIFNNYKKVFLGHYHGAQKLNDKVEYVGSPLQLNKGEANQTKHIIILNTDTLETQYIENTFSPKHLCYSIKDLDKYKNDFDNNFVELQIESNTDTVAIMDLTKEIVEEYKPRKLQIVAKPSKDLTEQDKEFLEETKKQFSDGELFEQYVKTHNKTLEDDKLLVLCRNIVSKAG